ncbi:Short-chain dehydrogenase/reductase SDR [Macleaya cordata]|uniref:Short-chain dehydrogenase/reductase SDR n=1 Tax=Macleaya cordata TaxID=56857 RepID=A0A200PU74_MACCD|nr:Short-chain dehydrogenase/reductase SDR [Macleaya cordata]
MRNIASGGGASARGIAAIVGVGPKLGRSIARKFAHEGYTVAILARRLSRFAEEIAREEKAQVFAIRIDCSDSRSVREAFEGVLSLGFVEVLVYNAHNHRQPAAAVAAISSSSSSSSSAAASFSRCTPQTQYHPIKFTDIRIDSFEKSLAVSTVGALHCAQQVLPGMVERGRGTILFTGCSASLNGIAGFSELCCGKFALRALSQCLAREVQPLGVHVAHIIIDGIVGTPSRSSSSSTSQRSTVGEQLIGGGASSMDPDALAQTYWYLHIQDRTAWTQEIDLRSSSSTQIYNF